MAWGKGLQILTITPDLPAPPSMLCFVVSWILGGAWPAFSGVSLSLARGGARGRTLGTKLKTLTTSVFKQGSQRDVDNNKEFRYNTVAHIGHHAIDCRSFCHHASCLERLAADQHSKEPHW